MIDFVSTPYSESTIIIEVSGEFTDIDRNYFFDCVGDFVEVGYKNIIVECHKLGHLNNGNFQSLLKARKMAKGSTSQIYLTHVSSNLGKALEITKLGQLLSIYRTTELAISNIERQLACVG